MADLFDARFGDALKFVGDVARRITPAEAKKLGAHPEVLEAMMAAMRVHPVFRLIHGRFTPLANKLELVKGWPGVTAEQIAAALAEFNSSKRKRRYEAAVEKHQLLDTVVTVYRASVPETLVYARDRMRDAFGDKYDEWKDAYGSGVDDNRVRLLAGVPEHRNCVRIEVVDLGAHFGPTDSFVPSKIRGPNSATFAVIYAAPQNPAWVWQMDGTSVPYALVGGLELNVLGYGEWTDMTHVWRSVGKARLGSFYCESRCREDALPVRWE